MSVETITLGCRLNFAESETIARTAPADEDWIIVNSCAVTNEAVAPDPPGDPPRQPRRPERAGSSSPAAPPSSTGRRSKPCPR